MKKRLFCLLLVFCLLFCSCTPSAPAAETNTREFTDSTGRTITVPETVTKIAISGPLSQIYILPLAGDLLVGVSNAYSVDAAIYLPDYITEKPEIGQLYGGKGEMDLEALLRADPDVVIDIGDAKDTVREDMDHLTAQTGIPFVHVDATVETAPEAYRLLGELIGREEKAEELASYCEKVLDQIHTLMEQVDADGARKSVLYCLGENGTHVIAKGSFHGDTVNLLADNLAVLEDVVASGAGNEVDLEQLLVWDPEVILFAPSSIYDTVGSNASWQSLSAVQSGQYYQEPYGPYGWLSSPPAVQRYLGMLWLGTLLYPDYINYDLQEAVTEYYRVFYGCELTNAMYETLIEHALPH